MHTSKDVQRDFYETGYGGSPLGGEEIIAGFHLLSPNTRINRATAMLQGVKGDLLDVGCGPGPLLYQIRDQFSFLHGVDIAEAQLGKVRTWAESLRRKVHVHRCNIDVEPLPLPDASVDAACCMVVLEFVIRPEFAVSEIARVLRPGGVFVCSTGNIVSWKNRLRVLVGLDPRTTTFKGALNGGALHHFTQATFLRMLTQSGFEVEKVECSGRLWSLRRFWPSLLGGDILVRARKPLTGGAKQNARSTKL